MNLHQWLAEPGRTAKALADSLGVSKTAVSLWRESGVPMRHMTRIEQLTGGAVTTADMLEHALQCRMANKGKGHAAQAATAAPAEAA